MQISVEEKLNPDHTLCSEDNMSEDFYTHLKLREENEAVDDDHGDDGYEEAEEEEEEEEEEFSFMCGGANTSPIAAEDAFVNGQIKPVFPLFNRDLLFSGEDSVAAAAALHESLPMRPPVKKVFVETSEENGQVTPENDDVSGLYCEWSERKAVEASPEACKKSNSTGFSKIWRFKDLLGRSNSDGRDAFVFLNNAHPPPPPSAAEQSTKGDEKSERTQLKEKAKKGKTAAVRVSAHEAYLRSKAKGEERRRSYLPYRPELMGFFTNVSGGLTKNVHPF
ncbi:hypothetical protein Sango_1019300 [Sesamum angolense]|uniref:Uncharacterized protein n=1 Tax=Sesamum angolense TaxID=2727404 RepID=A0AAE2BYV3_9LAMI|nr:hypothetical protein Sango_1019300 [Sesamum angolense]